MLVVYIHGFMKQRRQRKITNVTEHRSVLKE